MVIGADVGTARDSMVRPSALILCQDREYQAGWQQPCLTPQT